MRDVNLKCEISVCVRGESPNRVYHAHLQMGNQGFSIEPLYFENEDEDAEGSAEWVASMLYKALTVFVAGSGGTTTGIVRKRSLARRDR